jgi:hypothetical protein
LILALAFGVFIEHARHVGFIQALSHPIVSLSLGALISAVISFFFSLVGSRELRREAARYYQKASEDLRRETEAVSGLVADVQRDTLAINHYAVGLVGYLEEAGYIKPRRDQEGNLLVPVNTQLTVLWNVEGPSSPPDEQRNDAREQERPEEGTEK